MFLRALFTLNFSSKIDKLLEFDYVIQSIFLSNALICLTNGRKKTKKNPGFPAWIFSLERRLLRLVYAKSKCVQKIVS